MYNVEEAYEALIQVLESNSGAKTKDFWDIYFHWWRFFYSINENLEETPILNDKIALIEQFMQYSRELAKMETHILEKHNSAKKKLPSIEAIPFASHIQNMQQMLKKEQDRLSKLMKGVKKQKNPALIKKRTFHPKWLRS